MTGSAIPEIDQSADDLNATAARLRNQAARLTALARAMDVKGVATVKSAAAGALEQAFDQVDAYIDGRDSALAARG